MNQVGQSKPNPKKPNPYVVGDNVLETVRGLGANIGTAIQDEVTQKIPDNFIRDMFGGANQLQSELKPNEAINVHQEEAPKKVTPRDIIHALMTDDKKITQQEITQLRQQLEMYSKQTKNNEIKKAVIEQPTENPGVYHKNIFERLVYTAKKLTTNPDDGLTWFKEAGTRKKRKGFWRGFKDKGTKFGLSSERTASTQSG
jgi:hypothetical protein